MSTTARLFKTGLLIISCIALNACVTARVEEFMEERPVLGVGDAVVILTNRQDAVIETEDSFASCLYKNINTRGNQVTIISEEQFQDELFPWFEPRLAPSEPAAVTQLMNNRRIAARIEDLKVRYIVWIHGESEALNKQGAMSCTLSPAGAGCLGVLSWDNNSDYEASIWDLASGQSVGLISSEATGTSVVPAIGVPIPIIARTKKASCEGLADQLRIVLNSSISG